jgi:hypothetical protein
MNISKTLGSDFKYEPMRMSYQIPHAYLPDFVDAERKLIIEGKGRFLSADRTKHLAIKAQHPDWLVIICFYDPNKTLTKKSKTKYSDWCDKHGIAWCTLSNLKNVVSSLG